MVSDASPWLFSHSQTWSSIKMLCRLEFNRFGLPWPGTFGFPSFRFMFSLRSLDTARTYQRHHLLQFRCVEYAFRKAYFRSSHDSVFCCLCCPCATIRLGKLDRLKLCDYSLSCSSLLPPPKSKWGLSAPDWLVYRPHSFVTLDPHHPVLRFSQVTELSPDQSRNLFGGVFLQPDVRLGDNLLLVVLKLFCGHLLCHLVFSSFVFVILIILYTRYYQMSIGKNKSDLNWYIQKPAPGRAGLHIDPIFERSVQA